MSNRKIFYLNIKKKKKKNRLNLFFLQMKETFQSGSDLTTLSKLRGNSQGVRPSLPTRPGPSPPPLALCCLHLRGSRAGSWLSVTALLTDTRALAEPGRNTCVFQAYLFDCGVSSPP